MIAAAERMVAWRYLRPTRGEGFVSVIAGFALIGIALGVGTLIVVLAVMNGFRAELLDRVMGVNGHVTVVARSVEGLDGYDPLAEKLKVVPGVEDVMPYVEGQAFASGAGGSGVIVRGVRPEDLQRREIFADNIVEGSIEALGREGEALIGDRLARKLGVALGGTFNLISPEGAATAFGTMPRVKTFTVGGIFNVGMFEYDSGFVYVPLPDAQAYFNKGDTVSAIEVIVPDPEEVARYRVPLGRVVGDQGRLVDWQQLNTQFFNALEVERNVMFLILTLIILVAAFNIITGITMLVKSKGRDIAILRTVGASKGAITRIFLLSGASIGIAGTLIGFVLGLAFALNIDTIRLFLESMTGAELWSAEIRFLSQLPAKVEVDDTTRVVLMGLVLSFLATIYPAWRAARLDPVEALRYE